MEWRDFEGSQPDLATRIRRLFQGRRHHTMATIRRDGSPRLSGTEVEFVDGELRIGMMQGARRGIDLRRDSRVALHSQGIDPPPDNPSSWGGEAKISGRCFEGPTRQGAHCFRVDVAEAVLTTIANPPDHLIIQWWSREKGLDRFERR